MSVVDRFGAIGFAIVIVVLLGAVNARIPLTLNVKVSSGTADGDAVAGSDPRSRMRARPSRCT